LKRTLVLICVLLCLSVLTLLVCSISAQPSTEVAVDPSVCAVTVNSTFSVNINVTNIVNFTSWQLSLYYLNSVLNCTGAVEGSFLNSNGSTYFYDNIVNAYNSTYGCLSAYDTLLGLANWVNGGGVILTVNFSAVGAGTSNLVLAGTVLGDNEIPAKTIAHTDFDGVVNVTGAVPDVAVTNITFSKTVISQGYGGNITVAAANPGGYFETFNVTLYANTTIYVTSQNVTLSSGGFANVTFTWNTTGFAYGSYNISAYAWPVPGETNLANNNCTGGVVKVSIVGDINGDFKVNLSDLTLLAKAYNTKPGNPKWNPNADFKNEGMVGLDDLTLMARHYNTGIP